MIDIHCHVLPGVDDGVADVASARALCELAAADGTRAIIATPHQRHPNWANNDRQLLEERWATLREAVSDLVEIHLGAEVHMDWGFLAELERGAEGSILPLAGSQYLLIELPRLEARVPAEDILHEVSLAGYRPILAHPEFIPYLARDLDRVGGLVASGVLLQVTAMSITGGSGRGPKQWVWDLLEEGWVHFVASDAHSPTWRPPGLSEARQAIAQRFDDDVARLLTEVNPGRVLANQELEARPGL